MKYAVAIVLTGLMTLAAQACPQQQLSASVYPQQFAAPVQAQVYSQSVMVQRFAAVQQYPPAAVARVCPAASAQVYPTASAYSSGGRAVAKVKTGRRGRRGY